jgi:probable HAF family extracellular repeat protein
MSRLSSPPLRRHDPSAGFPRRIGATALVLLLASACVDDAPTGPHAPTPGVPVGPALRTIGSSVAFIEYPDGEFMEIHDMNGSGQVLGTAYLPEIDGWAGWVWHFGAIQEIGIIRSATAINDDGMVTGAGWYGEPFRWSNAGNEYASAGYEGRDINDQGDVVIRTAAEEAFLWTVEGSLTRMGPLPGQASNDPLRINNARQIMGRSGPRGYLWQNSVIRDLGTLGGTSTEPTDLNDAGQVVGQSRVAGDGAYHAFLWTATGGMQDLGTLGGTNSRANAVNASGQVAGWSQTASGKRHAFRWTAAEGMEDLGTLPTLSDSEALDINDAGAVTGFSQAGQLSRAYIWTEAGGLQLLGGGVGRMINNANQVVGGTKFWYNIVTQLRPIADAGGPYAGTAEQPILFDGSGTTDPDGDEVTFAWDFDDDREPDAGGVQVSHAFPIPGTYTVRLFATDEHGATRTDEATVTVAGTHWPVAVIAPPPGGTYTGAEGGGITFSSQGTVGENGGPLLYKWAFGDGTTAQSRFQTTPFRWSKAYADDGTYTARLIVVDTAGRADTATTTVVVSNTPPTATLAPPATVYENADFAFSLRSPTDSSAADRRTGFTYAFDCGIGNGFGPFGAAASGTCHSRVDNETYLVRARIRDKDGGVREYRHSLTTRNARPAITAATWSGGVLTISFTDAGTNDAPWRWVVRWGDDTRSTGSALQQGNTAIQVPHTYAGGGPYTALIHVYDKNLDVPSPVYSVTITP